VQGENNLFYFFESLTAVSTVFKRQLPHQLILFFDSADSIAKRLIQFYRGKYPEIPIIIVCDTTPEEAIFLRSSGADKLLSATRLSPSTLEKTISSLNKGNSLNLSFDSRNLEEILRYQQEGILVLDHTNDEILFCNPSAADLLGSVKEDLIGKPCYLFYKVDQPIECTIEHKDTSLHVQVFAKNIRWKNGQAILISMRDMSKRKALEALLRKEKFVQALQQLSGAIAHEFAQPLQVIKLIGEILRVEGVDPEYIGRLESNCNTMNELVMNLRSIVDLQIQSYPGGEIMDLRASANKKTMVTEN
ncbi:MAG: PAS domain-containing protein, partial [Calditrichota bacterium]